MNLPKALLHRTLKSACVWHVVKAYVEKHPITDPPGKLKGAGYKRCWVADTVAMLVPSEHRVTIAQRRGASFKAISVPAYSRLFEAYDYCGLNALGDVVDENTFIRAAAEFGLVAPEVAAERVLQNS